MPSLIVERGQEKGFTFTMRPGSPAVVGRDPANEVIISDPAASRRHFQIREADGVWLISDLGSRNHTYVNEEQLTAEVTLSFGDRVQVGETVFSFMEEEQGGRGGKGGLAGKDIGGYKILERVGRGGMGTVYKSRQISLNRIVALKILSTKFASDPSFVQQFVAEARAAGQLNHPNVVQVFDVGTAGGLHFFSMEFMDGGAVQDLLAQREGSRLDWIEAMPMIMDAARGLVFAERQGIVHRDIKPDNLMLTVEGQVKIGDLGLAAHADDEADGKIFGTPHFIAPEQARGKEVGHAADLYSLGASFYRMVTGRTPFSGQTVKEILRAQINDAHQPVTEIVPDFPPDLSAVVDKLMAKSLDQRYASASELVADLEAFEIAHKIELAGGVRRVSKGMMVGAAVAFLALIGVVIWQVTKDPEKETQYIEVPGETNGNTGPNISAEEIARQKAERRNSQAQIAFLQVKSDQPDGDIDFRNEAAWEAVARKFDTVAGEHEDTPAANDATARAKEIRAAIKTQREEHDRTVGAAKTWWAREKARIDGLLDMGDWSGVLSAKTEIETAPGSAEKFEYAGTAQKYLDDLEGEVLKRAKASFDTALAAADGKMKSGQPGEAMATMESWATGMDIHASAHDTLEQLAADARDWVEGQKATLVEQLEALRLQDRLAYVNAVRSIRPIPAAEDAVGTVWSFDFAAAADSMRTAGSSFKTWLYQERAEGVASRLDRMDAAWDGFIQALADGKIVAKGEELRNVPKVPPGGKSTINFTRPIDRDGFMVDVSIGAAKAGRPMRWAEMSPEAIWDMFLKNHLEELDGELALGMAWMFAELGRSESAAALVARAEAAGVTLDTAEKHTIESEIDAWTGYLALIAMRGESSSDQVLQAAAAWRARYPYTELYISADGAAPSELPDLFPSARVREFLDSWGVR